MAYHLFHPADPVDVEILRFRGGDPVESPGATGKSAISDMGFTPALQWREEVPSFENKKMTYISRWWFFQIFLFFIPIPAEMIQFDKYFSKGLKPPTRYSTYIYIYTYCHIFSICICTSGGTKNNKSGWLISGITVPAVIGISIDPGESLFKSNKGFIIEISFGSKSEFPLPHFATLVYQMKFLEGERFWVFQNLTHASCSWEVREVLCTRTSRITKPGIILSFTILYDTTRSCNLKLIPYHWIKFVPFVMTSIVSWCSLVHITWCWIARTTWTYCALFNYCILPYTTSVEVPACSIWLIHVRVFSTVLIYNMYTNTIYDMYIVHAYMSRTGYSWKIEHESWNMTLPKAKKILFSGSFQTWYSFFSLKKYPFRLHVLDYLCLCVSLFRYISYTVSEYTRKPFILYFELETFDDGLLQS